LETLESFFAVIGDLTWGWALIPFLVVLGLFFTVATGFVQLRYFGDLKGPGTHSETRSWSYVVGQLRATDRNHASRLQPIEQRIQFLIDQFFAK
jgi:Na+/alanine symporter